MDNLKHFLKILTVVFLLTVTKSFGQSNGCDTVYSYVEVMPKYDKDIKGLSDYLMKELVPIIGDCIKRDTEIIASLIIILTIDSNGKVIGATFPKHNLTSFCKDELKKKLLTMNGWTAGQKDGLPVCCEFNWPISCLKWE
ncbi:MAG: hypothetical protein IPJ83_08415 [Saprospiraceae bacterium]|nr:hypothetical protein [Candidatus Vicinibacter proximus]